MSYIPSFLSSHLPSRMSDGVRNIVMIVVMVVACMSAVGISLYTLYDEEVLHTQTRLRVAAQSQARLIEAIGRDAFRVDETMGTTNPDYDPVQASLRTILEAHRTYEGFGLTGEFTLARREEEFIVFLLRHRLDNVDQPEPVSFESELAEPMRRALRKQSGTMVGLDYRGETVLAAYEPVAILDFGLVAKIDLDEIRSAFITSSLIALFSTVFIALAAAFLIRRLGAPVVRKLQSQKKKLEDEVRRHQKAQNELKKWEQVFEHAGWGVMIAEPDSRRIIACNPAFAEMHGYSVEEIKTLRIVDLITAEFKDQLPDRTELLRSTGRQVFESEHIRKDGSEFPVLGDVMTVYDKSGTLIYHAANYRDVTKQRASERALQKSERRLQTAQRIAGLGFLDLNLETGMVHLSEQTRRIFGFDDSREIFDSDFLTKWAHPDDREEVQRRLELAVSGEQDYLIDHRLVRNDGETVWVHSQAVLVRNEDGQPVSLLGTMLDITVRVKLEEERISLERQMLQAQKLESMGILAGGIAHDFNNLLMTILGNTDLVLQDLPAESPIRKSLDTIEKSAQRAAELSSQMLAYSGMGQFVVEPVSINEVVTEMTHLLEVGLSKSVDLSFSLADDLPTIDGDATQIRQVVMNLIMNASEAIGDSGGVISVSTGACVCDRECPDISGTVGVAGSAEPLKAEPCIYFEVTDTGCGMTEEVIERIFEPFFTTKFTGRGLGLAAVLGIVHGHEGSIKINSQPEMGTTIRVLFPVGSSVVSSHGSDDRTQQPNDDWRGEGLVLLVDDEEAIRVVTGELLKRVGFDVVTAADGREAIERFREHSDEIRCILLDLTMPYVDGREAFGEIRAIRGDVAVIICSGYNDERVARDFIGEKRVAFLQKPYRMLELRQSIRDILLEPGP